ncbi:MAG: hypothetical protein D6753_01775 [Planctomycetota bacterium]|nr:MAG: hypothetical protein D6753_01775 [Planctomycetota bacterium]
MAVGIAGSDVGAQNELASDQGHLSVADRVVGHPHVVLVIAFVLGVIAAQSVRAQVIAPPPDAEPQPPSSVEELPPPQPQQPASGSGNPSLDSHGAEIEARSRVPQETGLDQAKVEILSTGPLHEAFVGTERVYRRMQPSAVPPPAPLSELPPSPSSFSESAQWIPGYWDWDSMRGEFVWVSGFYRRAPPGRKWVPTAWVKTEGGSERIAGYWGEAEQDRPEVLPPLPESLPEQPSAPPSDDAFWIPGSWEWKEGEYVWRAGYWTRRHPRWIWQPAQYIEVPDGVIHVSGYWDYELPVRGIPSRAAILHSPSQPGGPVRCVPVAAKPEELLHRIFIRPGDPRFYYSVRGVSARSASGPSELVPWFLSTDVDHAILRDYYEWDFRRRGQSLRTALLPDSVAVPPAARSGTAPGDVLFELRVQGGPVPIPVAPPWLLPSAPGWIPPLSVAPPGMSLRDRLQYRQEQAARRAMRWAETMPRPGGPWAFPPLPVPPFGFPPAWRPGW